jgi:hypothetical protein
MKKKKKKKAIRVDSNKTQAQASCNKWEVRIGRKRKKEEEYMPPTQLDGILLSWSWTAWRHFSDIELTQLCQLSMQLNPPTALLYIFSHI